MLKLFRMEGVKVVSLARNPTKVEQFGNPWLCLVGEKVWIFVL